MRRGVLIFIAANLLLVAFLVRSVFTLLSLLVEDAADDAIRKSNLPAANSSLIESRKQIIPKIIHQTYKNETVPPMWKAAQQSCIDLHPDYEYMLWTDKRSVDFIAAEYPWFLDTFKNYRHPIQRADSIRYFVLAYYGGTYIDLDDGCNRRLDPLLSFPAWLRRTAPTGISNDAMGAIPQHPFFLRVIDSIQSYNKNWLLPYLTVMYSTGPLFLSVIWKEYMLTNPIENDRVRVLMQDAYNRYSWSFFTHHPGSSWHGQDARLIFWMGNHWFLLTITGFLLAGIVFFFAWWAYRRVIVLISRFCHRYSRLPSNPGGSLSPPPRATSPSGRKLGILPSFLQRPAFLKQDVESGTSETVYELINRDD